MPDREAMQRELSRRLAGIDFEYSDGSYLAGEVMDVIEPYLHTPWMEADDALGAKVRELEDELRWLKGDRHRDATGEDLRLAQDAALELVQAALNHDVPLLSRLAVREAERDPQGVILALAVLIQASTNIGREQNRYGRGLA